MKIYSIYKRRKNNGDYFCVKFKDEDTGMYGTAKSVEALRKLLGDNERHHITKRPEAESIVIRAIEKGLDGNGHQEDQDFATYLANFWDYDKSAYIKKENRKSADKLAIGRDYASNMAGCVKNHVVPYLPKGLKCSQVKKRHIENIQNHAIDDCSVNVWLLTLKALSKPIKELRRSKVLIEDPLFDLDRYNESNISTVGALTDRETDQVIRQMYYDLFTPFEYEYKAKGIDYNGKLAKGKGLLDKRIYLATCLSSATGLRKGEIMGLRADCVRFPNSNDQGESQALIDVQEAYAKKQGFKTPKAKINRTVPCPLWLAQELVEFAETNPSDSGLIFYSDQNPSKPLDFGVFNKWFYIELNHALGMDEAERTKRHIVFHSLRHYANTEYRTRTTDEKTQRIIGHTSSRMTDRYDAGSDRRIIEIGREAGDLIQDPRARKEA